MSMRSEAEVRQLLREVITANTDEVLAERERGDFSNTTSVITGFAAALAWVVKMDAEDNKGIKLDIFEQESVAVLVAKLRDGTLWPSE